MQSGFRLSGVFFCLYNPVPFKPTTAFTYVVYICSEILGLGGGCILKQIARRKFQLFNDKRHALSIFFTHAQEADLKILEINTTSILNILARSLFEN